MTKPTKMTVGPSLIRVSQGAQWVAADRMFFHADSEGSDRLG